MSEELQPYKGYRGSIQIEDDGTVFGKLLGITDLICYYGPANDPSALQKAFEEAVDDYIDTCHEMGWEPKQCKVK